MLRAGERSKPSRCWSPGTAAGRERDVVELPDSGASAYAAGSRRRGKFVLARPISSPDAREDQWAAYATPASQDSIRAAAGSVKRYGDRAFSPLSLRDVAAAGAAGVITHGFSGYPGIDKVFGSPRLRVLTLDVTCEDYGLLARLAERRQSPRLRVDATTELRGERPVFNTIAEIRGREKPDEYVILSAHFDSWTASAGQPTTAPERSRMVEAMRILRT